MSVPLLIAGLVVLSLIVASQFLLARRAKRIERDLREELHKARLRAEAFQNLMEHATFEVVLKDSEGRYVEVSRSWQEFNGTSGEDATGKTPQEVFGDDFGVGMSARDQRALNEGRSIETEDEAPHTDGTTHLFHTITFPIPGEDGNAAGLGLISTDITERKRTEWALRESEEQLRTITDNLPVLIVRWDREQKYRFANRTTELWYGLPASEIIGKTIPEVFGDKAYETVRWAIKKGLSGEVVMFEQRLEYPDGVTRDVEIAYIPDRAEDGGVLGCFALVQDISGRKVAEKALRESEEQLRTITDNLPALIARVDREKRFRFVNKSAEQWYGRPVSEIVGKTVFDLFGQSVPEKVAWAVDACQLGEIVQFEQRIKYPDGVTRDAEIAYVPDFAENGEIQGYFALVQDITARKNLEAELLRKERLAAMGQLTGTVAHELRNPLGAVAMSLGVIRQKTADAEFGLERALDRAGRGIRRCETIITELLDFARAKGLQPQPTSLDNWLAELLDEYEMPAGVSLSRELQCVGLEPEIDRDALRRAVINLLDNACDSMVSNEDGGDNPHNLAVSTRIEGDRAEIIVADSGPGIPADILPDIMEPLFSTKSFGTGLGLPTVRRIMEEHGGGIEIESEPGQGALVRLWLPLNAPGPEGRKDES